MSRPVIECKDNYKHFSRKDRKFKALKAKKPAAYPFAGLPFVNRKLAEHKAQPEYWDVDLGGGYFGGYKVGEAMALAYLKCDRIHGQPNMDYFLTKIVTSFVIQYERAGGFKAVEQSDGNDGGAALRGQFVGFFNTISQRLALASRLLFHDLDRVTEQELIDIANIGMQFDHVAYMASLKD